MQIRIAIAEDNAFLANAVIEKLSFFDEFRYKFRGENGQELIDMLEKDHIVDVVLMDIQMPGMDGITATEQLKRRWPQIKVIILTVMDDDENIFKAIQAGANGYLLKDIDPESLKNGILDVMNGGAPMSPSIAVKTLELLRNPGKIQMEKPEEDAGLTRRETEILEQLAKGLNYQGIAENLFISQGTVRKHIENIYRKLQVHNKMEAVLEAKKQRIL